MKSVRRYLEQCHDSLTGKIRGSKPRDGGSSPLSGAKRRGMITVICLSCKAEQWAKLVKISGSWKLNKECRKCKKETLMDMGELSVNKYYCTL